MLIKNWLLIIIFVVSWIKNVGRWTQEILSSLLHDEIAAKYKNPDSPKLKSFKEIFEEVNGAINAVAKISPAIGGLFLLLYADQQGFLNKLIDDINIVSLIFLAVFSLFVFSCGLCVGTASAYWLVAFLRSKWLKKNPTVPTTLVPKRKLYYWILFVLSIAFFMTLIYIAINKPYYPDPSAFTYSNTFSLLDLAFFLFLTPKIYHF